MRGVYTVTMSNATITGASTLAFINPGTTCSIRILRVDVAQSSSTTSAQQRIQLVTQVTAFPTLTSTTPVQTSTRDQASAITGGTAGAAGTSGTNASAEGAGAKTILHASVFNILTGWLWVPTPAEVIVMSAGASSGFGVFLPAAPSSTSGWNCVVEFEEA